MNHQWKYSVRGVANGSGMPHGIVEEWRCERCEASKVRRPESTHTGKRVVRIRHYDPHGHETLRSGKCE